MNIFLAQTLRKLQYLKKRQFYHQKRRLAALNDETAKYMNRTWPDDWVVVCDLQKYLYHFSSSNIKKVTTFKRTAGSPPKTADGAVKTMYTEKFLGRPFQNCLKLFWSLKIKGDMKFSKHGQIIMETADSSNYRRKKHVTNK